LTASSPAQATLPRDLPDARRTVVIEAVSPEVDAGRFPVKRAVGEGVVVEANIFAPCALGGIINDETIPQLKVDIVAGGANNQLAEERHGDMLEARGITYAPDYVINAGGLVNVNAELEGWTMERARNKAGEIYDTILMLFDIAAEEHMPSYRAADRLAERRIAAIAKVRQNFV